MAVIPLIILVYVLACPFFAGFAAESKGLNAPLWFFGGLFFGPLALLALCATASKVKVTQ